MIWHYRHQPAAIHCRLMAAAMLSGVTLALAGCGGSVSDSQVVSLPLAPPPLVSPPREPTAPTPPSPPTPTTFLAPAVARAPAVPGFPQAVAGGPTIAAPGNTVLPLLQTVQVSTAATLGPDLATMDSGATLILDPTAREARFSIANAALAVSNVGLHAEPNTVYFETSGTTVIRLAYAALDWTLFGSWYAHPDNGVQAPAVYASEFVTGFQTSGSAMPTSGSANYSGGVFGEYGYLSGSANLQVNFADQTLTGTLTDMEWGSWDDGYSPWNSVSLSASFAGGQSQFSGSTAVTSAPDNTLSLGANATGTVVGSFFGPNAEEIGAVWTLFDGTNSATGTIGARTRP